jgi:hypothetical protein
MRTNYKILSSSVLLIFSLLVSCEKKSLDEELQDWCNCKQINQNQQECESIIASIIEREEYNPEALAIIRQRILQCKQ